MTYSPPDRSTRALLLTGVIAPLVFIAVAFIEGALRVGYDPMRHAVSSLELTDRGWIQIASFVQIGILMVPFAVGVRRTLGGRWAPAMLVLFGIGQFGAAVFYADPGTGYPPGAPESLALTGRGTMHVLLSGLSFIGLTVAAFVVAKRMRRNGNPGWTLYSVLAGIGFFFFMQVSSMAFQHQLPGLAPIGGALQRVGMVLGYSWIALLAWRLRRPLSEGDVDRAGESGAPPSADSPR